MLALGMLTLAGFVILLPFLSVDYSVGSKEVALTFMVTDGDTGLSVHNARIRIHHQAIRSIASEAQTDVNGRAEIVHPFKIIGRETLFTQSANIVFYSEALEVLADGYLPLQDELVTYTGFSIKKNALPLPAMTVKLKRAKLHAQQRE
jgi:hypothetical protein